MSRTATRRAMSEAFADLPHEECVAAQLENQQFEDERNDIGERVDWMLIGATAAIALVSACCWIGSKLATLLP